MRARWHFALPACVSTALVAGAVLASNSSSQPTQSAKPRTEREAFTATPVAEITQGDPSVFFGVLRDAGRGDAATRVPAKDAGRLDRGFSELTKQDPAVTASARKTERVGAVVQANAESVCLTLEYKTSSGTYAGGSSGCSPADSATNAKTPIIDITAVGDSETAVTALLVDGTRDVRVDGRPVSLENNVATTILNERATKLSWTTPQGTQHSTSLSNPR